MDINTINQSGAGLKLMGHTIFWRLDGTITQYEELATNLSSMGLENHLPPLPSAKVTLKAAVSEWANENLGRTSTKKTLIRTINKRRSKNLAYVVVGEITDFEELGLGYTTEMSLIMDKKTEAVTLLTGGNNERTESVKQQIVQKWDSLRLSVPANELSKIIKNILMAQGAFNLKRGVYFLPDLSGNSTLIGQLATFVAGLSESAFMIAAPMVDNAAIKAQLERALYAGVIDELNQLRQDASRLASRMMKDDSEVSEDTVNVRLAKYQELREKIWQVEDAMGQAAIDCKEYIDQLQEIITAIDIDEDDVEIFCTEAQEFINIKKAKKQKEKIQEASQSIKEIDQPQGKDEEDKEFAPMTIPIVPLEIEKELDTKLIL